MPWLRRLRGALGMSVTWAIAWAVVGGGIMEGIVDPDGRMLDMWPQTLAIPGFLSGLLFSAALATFDRRRRFDDLSYRRVAGWGLAAGAVLGTAALAAGIFPTMAPLVRAGIVLLPLTALGVGSATATLAVARAGSARVTLPPSEVPHTLPREDDEER